MATGGEGRSLADLAPTLLSEISGRASRLSVAEALHANGWLRAIHPELSFQALVDLLVVHDRVAEVILSDDDDRFCWKWSGNGTYMASSAYVAFFRGRVLAAGATEVWSSKAPTKSKTFMWLALKNRCCMADRLSKWGLPHPARCPLCDQSDETIDHLLLGCVVAQSGSVVDLTAGLEQALLAPYSASLSCRMVDEPCGARQEREEEHQH